MDGTVEPKDRPRIVEVLADDGARRYEVSDLDGVRIAVVIDRTGQREVVLLTEEDDEPVLTLLLTERQARALAAVLDDRAPRAGAPASSEATSVAG